MNKTPYRISELPVGRTKAYQEINEGRLRAVKCGKLTLISETDFNGRSKTNIVRTREGGRIA